MSNLTPSERSREREIRERCRRITDHRMWEYESDRDFLIDDILYLLDRLDSLEKQVERAREALEKVANCRPENDRTENSRREIARQALQDMEDGDE